LVGRGEGEGREGSEVEEAWVGVRGRVEKFWGEGVM